jgi:predicted nucleotidyltransferase
MERMGGVKLAFIYGSFAANRQSTMSDIDLLIVGNPNEDKLIQEMESAEKTLRREINYNIYPLKEFKAKLKSSGSFIQNILKRPKIILKGRINEV